MRTLKIVETYAWLVLFLSVLGFVTIGVAKQCYVSPQLVLKVIQK